MFLRSFYTKARHPGSDGSAETHVWPARQVPGGAGRLGQEQTRWPDEVDNRGASQEVVRSMTERRDK
jgi:hypothetical protein